MNVQVVCIHNEFAGQAHSSSLPLLLRIAEARARGRARRLRGLFPLCELAPLATRVILRVDALADRER